MEEELTLIRQRLDVMEGALLAHQFFLTAIGQEVQKKDVFAILGSTQIEEELVEQLRYSSASDLKLQSFQQTISELREKLS